MRPRPVFYLLCLVSLLAPAIGAEGEAGRFYIQNFTQRDFEGHNQVFDLAQASDGVMYLTNRGAILEYDGATWRRALVPTTWIRNLWLDARNRVYVAGTDELGYCEHDPHGGFAYHSLLGQLPAELRQPGAVWGVQGFRNAVYFGTSTHVFSWQNNAFQVRPMPPAARIYFAEVRGGFYLFRSGDGLYRLDESRGEFVAVNRDPALVASSRFVMLDDPARDPVIALSSGRLFHWRDDRLVPWAHPAAAWLEKAGVLFGLRLADGRMAFSTQYSGVVLLSLEGRLLQVFNQATGLSAPQVYKLFQDREGSLWVGHFSGASRIELDRGYTLFDALNGKEAGNLADVVRHGDDLYTYSIEAVYRIQPSQPGCGLPARLQRLDLPITSIWAMADHRDGPLLGNQEGLYQLVHGKLHLLQNFPDAIMSFTVAPDDPDLLLVGQINGLSLLRQENGVWRSLGPVAGITAEVRSIQADGPETLWLGTTTRGFIRLTRRSPQQDWREAKIDSYLGSRGVPADAGWCNVLRVPYGLVFLTTKGIYRHDRATDTFIPDRRWTINGRTDYDIAPFTSNDTGAIWLQASEPGTTGEFQLGRFDYTRSASPAWQAFPRSLLQRAGYDGAKAMTRDDTADGEVLWLGGTDSLVRVETAKVPLKSTAPWHTLIREVRQTGQGRWSPAATKVRLRHSLEPLTIAFAAPLFTASAPVTYQHRLVGYDGEWSDWSPRTEAIYTNLSGGPFTFEVRARDGDGRVSEPARFTFAVTPPWPRSPAAYLFYGLAGLAVIAGYIRWRLGAVRREQHRLEKIVAARTAELAVARDEAEAANRAKSTFLAHMSHELRTPLNGVIGYAQVLLNDRSLTGPQRERASIVHTSGTHLLRLINEVLDFSKIEAGHIERSDAPFHPHQLLDELAALHEPAAATKGLAFTVRRPDSLPEFVTGDPQKLRQVLDNLLSNAVKFTRTGRVSLNVEPAGAEAWTFSVTDTGVGLSAGELAGLFQPFAQAAGRPAGEAGTGLGLVITRRLVQLLGGDLHVASMPGAGSRFHFTLTLPAAGAPTGSSHPPFPAGRYAGPARRVLIVDDVKLNRDLLADLLAPLGFVSESHVSAEEALATLEGAPPPDLAIIDVKLPGIDGLELTRRLRARPETARLPIVLSSASVLTFDADAAARAGSNEFLPKPFAVTELIGLLTRLLGLNWAPPAAPGMADGGARLEPALVQSLLVAADAGDVTALRDALAAARRRQPGASSFLDQLEKLVAGYQLERARQLLRSLPS